MFPSEWYGSGDLSIAMALSTRDQGKLKRKGSHYKCVITMYLNTCVLITSVPFSFFNVRNQELCISSLVQIAELDSVELYSATKHLSQS